MEKYDYIKAVAADIVDYAHENEMEFKDEKELDSWLKQEEFRDDDSVTGNSSGSYYCNSWKAEEALCHNWDLIQDMVQAYDLITYSPETLDVACRLFVLPGAKLFAKRVLMNEITD